MILKFQYGGWGTTVILFFVRKSCVSRWRNESRTRHSPGRLLLTFSTMSQRQQLNFAFKMTIVTLRGSKVVPLSQTLRWTAVHQYRITELFGSAQLPVLLSLRFLIFKLLDFFISLLNFLSTIRHIDYSITSTCIFHALTMLFASELMAIYRVRII